MALRALFIAVMLTLSVVAAPVLAQRAGQVFVQIEAHPTLAEARERAQAYSALLPNINGFALGSGWYGLALGPYEESSGRGALRVLRAQGLIPRDSYLTRGASYGQRFWPAGLQSAGAGQALAEPPARPIEPAPGSASNEPEIEPPAPLVVTSDENVRQARASEARLSRAEKMDLQRALAWFGHYEARIDGSYGRGTRNAMAAWQQASALPVTGVLTTRQRESLLEEWREDQSRLGLARLDVPEAGIALTAPVGLVRFDRIEAPFVHYQAADEPGLQLSLISQAGDRLALAGLYEILQGLEIVPTGGQREIEGDQFRIRGEAPGQITEAFAKVEAGHIVGYLLTWPAAETLAATRALAQMEATLASVGEPLDPKAGVELSAQSPDMVSGLEVRQPLRAASGFFVDRNGVAVTAASNVAACGRITLDRRHEARVVLTRDGVAVLRPVEALAPVDVAMFASAPGRLRSAVSVGGFPFGGVLGTATLSFGTLEDVRGVDGDPGAMRLALEARDGEVGGPVLDPSGRVAGMLLPDPDLGGRVLPPDVAVAVQAATLRPILAEAGVKVELGAEATAVAPEDLATKAAGMTALVSCWE
ncbi:MAG: serine protease [Pseudomonadota bacterium]